MFRKMTNYAKKSSDLIMTKKQLDIRGNWKRTIQSVNSTGGLVYERSSKIMSKDAGHANNSRLIEIHPNPQ